MLNIKESISPWNCPVFVLVKKSEKWRMVTDLRSITKVIQPMGSLQPVIPLSSRLHKRWSIIIIDLKDCFLFIVYKKRLEKNLHSQCLLIIILWLIKDISKNFSHKGNYTAYPLSIFNMTAIRNDLCTVSSICNFPLCGWYLPGWFKCRYFRKEVWGSKENFALFGIINCCWKKYKEKIVLIT